METPFAYPATPGWQVFLDALVIFLGENPTREAQIAVSSSLEARKSEFIPDDHRNKICSLVLQVGVRSADGTNDYHLPPTVVEFLHYQIGRDALTKMLAERKLTAGKWDVVGSNDDAKGIGYKVYTTDQVRFRCGVINESSRRMYRSLLGNTGLVEVNMKELFDLLRSLEHASEEPATPAAETAEPK